MNKNSASLLPPASSLVYEQFKVALTPNFLLSQLEDLLKRGNKLFWRFLIARLDLKVFWIFLYANVCKWSHTCIITFQKMIDILWFIKVEEANAQVSSTKLCWFQHISINDRDLRTVLESYYARITSLTDIYGALEGTLHRKYFIRAIIISFAL